MSSFFGAEPAFPVSAENIWNGLDTRTYIATHIASGLIANYRVIAKTDQDLAKAAVGLADALIEELNKTK